MADLFAGTFNFTPAFTGRELAIKSGAAAAQAWTSGVNAGSGQKNAAANMLNAQTNAERYGGGGDDGGLGMGGFSSWLQGVLGQ